ncbi:MAG: outer membrane lipoprotein-sorting protein, partial [Nannocystaceae bacterium]
TLVLTPKEGIERPYAKLELVIDSKKGGVTKVRYYDGAGNHVRTQTREGWTKINGELMPTKVTMEDHKTNDSTVVELRDVRVNQGVEDDLFSRRMLLRG